MKGNFNASDQFKLFHDFADSMYTIPYYMSRDDWIIWRQNGMGYLVSALRNNR